MYMGGNSGRMACYWLNGERRVVATYENTFVNGMYVEKDGTVHCAGREGVGANWATYWTDEFGWMTFDPYDEYNGNATGVTVDEETGDVYFAAHFNKLNADGTQTSIAGYYKNLVKWTPVTAEEPNTGASSGDIVFQDGNLYMAFKERGTTYYTVNGERHEMELMGDANYISCMLVQNGDVYIGGWYLVMQGGEYIYAPCYWKNGEGVALTVEYGCPYAIFVDDNGDVYLAGAKGPGFDRCAAYWKNDEPAVELSSYNNGCAGGIFVVEGNLLVTGFESNDAGNSVLKYWLNGEETAVTDGSVSCGNEVTIVI